MQPEAGGHGEPWVEVELSRGTGVHGKFGSGRVLGQPRLEPLKKAWPLDQREDSHCRSLWGFTQLPQEPPSSLAHSGCEASETLPWRAWLSG